MKVEEIWLEKHEKSDGLKQAERSFTDSQKKERHSF